MRFVVILFGVLIARVHLRGVCFERHSALRLRGVGCVIRRLALREPVYDAAHFSVRWAA